MSDSVLSFQPCKQIAARRLSEDIWLLPSYREGEKWGSWKEIGWGKEWGKYNEREHLMF